MSQKLQGKTALVTGGSRGIGAAIARRLASEGASVALTYGGSKEKAEAVANDIIKAGGKAFVVHGDASKPETMQGVADAVVKKFGRIDILVNNAGIFEGGAPIQDAPLEALDRTININVKSLFTLTQAVVKVMNDNGRVINLSSVLGERGIFAGASIYNMSKFAVNGLTRSWAHDLAPRGITVNSILPGPIATDMGDPNAANITAMKRLGTPEEVAAVASFLASPDASYVTGAEITVDGGANA
jgi:3-oxoacyl-[acyl-carrier protein] reductase